MDHFPNLTTALPVLKGRAVPVRARRANAAMVASMLVGVLSMASIAVSRADEETLPCKASGWDMTRELKAYAGDARPLASGSATWNIPVVWADTLYTLAFHPQDQVHFIQESPNAPRAPNAMAGLARFTVLTTSRYRVTVDTALWIDAVDATDIVKPSAYITWHQCPQFRKSVEYRLQAGQSILLQFSGASAGFAKVTIEPLLD